MFCFEYARNSRAKCSVSPRLRGVGANQVNGVVRSWPTCLSDCKGVVAVSSNLTVLVEPTSRLEMLPGIPCHPDPRCHLLDASRPSCSLELVTSIAGARGKIHKRPRLATCGPGALKATPVIPHLAGQIQWHHVGKGAPPVLVYCGDWDFDPWPSPWIPSRPR